MKYPILVAGILGSQLIPAAQAQEHCAVNDEKSAARIMKMSENSLSLTEKALLLTQAVNHCATVERLTLLGLTQQEIDTATAIQTLNEADTLLTALRDVLDAEVYRSRKRNILLPLAESLAADQQIAAAVSTLDELRNLLRVDNITPDNAFFALQGTLDDALTQSDATVLTASLSTQKSRGIGVRAKPKPKPLAEAVQQQVDPAPVATSTTVANQTVATATAAEPMDTHSSTSINIQILFDSGSARVSDSDAGLLDTLSLAIDSLELAPTATVFVIGHTDPRGSRQANQQLSERRANTVLTELANRLSQPVTLKAVGKGESELRYPDNSAESNRRNRRVELMVQR